MGLESRNEVLFCVVLALFLAFVPKVANFSTFADSTGFAKMAILLACKTSLISLLVFFFSYRSIENKGEIVRESENGLFLFMLRTF